MFKPFLLAGGGGTGIAGGGDGSYTIDLLVCSSYESELGRSRGRCSST